MLRRLFSRKPVNRIKPQTPAKPEEVESLELLLSDPGRRFVDPDFSRKIIQAVNAKAESKTVKSTSHTLSDFTGLHKNDINIDEYLAGIPRYPPYKEGIVTVTPEDIMRSQSDLINSIFMKFTHSQDMFAALVIPVIRNLAAWVHLLPASQLHHHRSLGGAFRHALEVATYVSTSSKSLMADKRILKKDIDEYCLRLQVGSIIAALLHDAGKPVSDIAVISDDGKLQWNPFSGPLYDWAYTHKVKRYYVSWRTERSGRHTAFSPALFAEIVPKQVREWLNHFGPDIQYWILETIQEEDVENRSNPILGLVKRADSHSTANDIGSSHNKGETPDGGVSHERNIIDTMRRLINESTWPTNERGSPLWVDLEGNVFLIWTRAAADIIQSLNKYNIPGIFRSADSIAETLFDRGIIAPNPFAEECGVHPMYWLIQPSALSSGRDKRPSVNVAVCLSDMATLFPSRHCSEKISITVFESDPREQSNDENGSGSTWAERERERVAAKERNAEQRNARKGAASRPEIEDEPVQKPAAPIITAEAEVVFKPQTKAKAKPAAPGQREIDFESKPAASAPPDSAEPAIHFEDVQHQQMLDSAQDILPETVLAAAHRSVIEGPTKGMMAFPWPLLANDEDGSIELLEKLGEAKLLCIDPAFPLKQLFQLAGQEWIVLAVPAATSMPEISAGPSPVPPWEDDPEVAPENNASPAPAAPATEAAAQSKKPDERAARKERASARSMPILMPDEDDEPIATDADLEQLFTDEPVQSVDERPVSHTGAPTVASSLSDLERKSCDLVLKILEDLADPVQPGIVKITKAQFLSAALMRDLSSRAAIFGWLETLGRDPSAGAWLEGETLFARTEMN